MAKSEAIQVEGLRELNREIRRSVDRELPKRMGQANKSIGELVIARLSPRPDPAAVGEGAGSTVRPSASKREVLLRVGGAHRAGKAPRMQWGKRPVRQPGVPAPKRPYIRQTVDRYYDEITGAYLGAIEQAMGPAFYDSDF